MRRVIPSSEMTTEEQFASMTPEEIEAVVALTRMRMDYILNTEQVVEAPSLDVADPPAPLAEASGSLSDADTTASIAGSSPVLPKREPKMYDLRPPPIKRGREEYTSPVGLELGDDSGPSKRRCVSPPQQEVGGHHDEVIPGPSGVHLAGGSGFPEQRAPATQLAAREPRDREPVSAEAAAESKKKRSPKGDGLIKAEEDRIFRSIRDSLSARSGDRADFRAFGDAVLPNNHPSVQLPIFTEAMEVGMRSRKPAATGASTAPRVAVGPTRGLGDAGTLHASEVALCGRLSLPYDVYRCQKGRIFLGVAASVAFYERKLAQEPGHKARDFGVSQGQQVANVDVKTTSTLMRAFETWGWLPQVIQKDARHKGRLALTDACKRAFPPAHRLRLLQEVARFESGAGNVQVAGDVLSDREKRDVFTSGSA